MRIAVQSIMFAALWICCSIYGARLQAQQWLPSNGPYGAVSEDLVMTPANTFLLADEYNGIWRSTDGCASWQPTTTGIGSRSVAALAVLKDGSVMAGASSGLFRSTDDGVSWERAETGLTKKEISDIVVLSDGTVFCSVWTDGVYRSTNAGASWEAVHNGLTQLSLYCIRRTQADHLFAGSFGSGAFRSTDKGDSWQQLSLSGYVYDIAESPGGVLFASVHASGIRRSTDGGQSWHFSDDGIDGVTGYGFVFRSESEILFGATVPRGMRRSTDGGATWFPFNQGFSLSWTTSLQQMPNGDCYATTYGDGVYRLRKDSIVWRAMNEGVRGTYLSTLERIPGHGVFTGGYGGVSVTRDGGGSWAHTDSSLGMSMVYDLQYAHQALFAGGNPGGISKSTDFGAHWLPSHTGFTPDRATSFCVDPDGRLYAGSNRNGIFISIDHGDSWVLASQDASTLNIVDMSTDGSGAVYAATNDGVYKSINDGVNWNKVSDGLPDNWPYCILVKNGRIYSGFDEGLYKSTNGGVTWSRTGAAQIASSVTTLNADASGAIVAISGTACWRSSDNGQSWQMIGDGLPQNDPVDIEFDDQGALYAATEGKGVYKLTPSSTGVKAGPPAVPQALVLRQNVPNPCSARTSFIFELLHPEFVTLVVTDLLGRECARVLDRQDFSAGEHRIAFDASSLNPGLYLYRLEAGPASLSKKLVVLR